MRARTEGRTTIVASSAATLPAGDFPKQTTFDRLDEVQGDPEAAAHSTRLGFVATAQGQRHQVEVSRPLSDVVAAFEREEDAIGVIVSDAGRFVTMLSKDTIGKYLSEPFTQHLFLHKPISALLESRCHTVLEFPYDEDVSAVIAVALGRPPAFRYEPIVACGTDGARCLVDVHSLMAQQYRILEDTVAALKDQRAATAAV